MPNIRRLAYKDRYVWRLKQEISGGSSLLPPIQFQPGTPTQFTVQWTQEQWNEVFSALMTGADLSYPEKSHEVVWHLLRQVEYPMALLPPAGNDSRVDLWARLNIDLSWTQFYNGVTQQPFGHYINQVTPAINQSYVWKVYLTPGNWNLEVLWVRLPNSANARIYWSVFGSGVVNNITTLNMHGTVLYNQRSQYTFTVTSAEMLVIGMTAISLPAGSTNYYMGLTGLNLWRE